LNFESTKFVTVVVKVFILKVNNDFVESIVLTKVVLYLVVSVLIEVFAVFKLSITEAVFVLTLLFIAVF